MTHIRVLDYTYKSTIVHTCDNIMTHIWLYNYTYGLYIVHIYGFYNYTYMITGIWLQVYDYRYMITGIWLQVYDCRHMISNIWYDDRHMIADIWYPYMVKLKDPMSAHIWSYTAVYGFHVYDSGARIWDTYMCMQTYDTHICVPIPLRWNKVLFGDSAAESILSSKIKCLYQFQKIHQLFP